MQDNPPIERGRLTVRRDPEKPMLLWDDPVAYVATMTDDEKSAWLRHCFERVEGSTLHKIALLILEEAGL